MAGVNDGSGEGKLFVALSVPLCLLAITAASCASAQAQSRTVAPGSQYVAMGSSYAAGFGIQPQVPGAASCGRSELDYPHLVAARLHLELEDPSGHNDDRRERRELRRHGYRVWATQLNLCRNSKSDRD